MVAPCTTRRLPVRDEECAVALLESRGLVAKDYLSYLSANEKDRYHEITSDKRRAKWLAGRLAAKYLFLSRFELAQARTRDGVPCLVDLSAAALNVFSPWMYRKVEVLPKSDGPNAGPRFIWCDDQRTENVSLSHTDTESCACLAFAGPASIDIERSIPRVNAFYRKTFTDAERQWVSSGAGTDKTSAYWLFTLLWTLKESALKLESVDQAGVWDLPRIEIGDLPRPDRFLVPRHDSNFV